MSSTKAPVLQVTQVQVFPFSEGITLGHIKGLASVVLADQIIIHGIRIMEGEHGMFIAYPVDPFSKGDNFRSIVNPITSEQRAAIEAAVLEKYNAEK